MGKISKPQRSNKHKKIKAVDPFYVGDRPIDRFADNFNLNPKRKRNREGDDEFSSDVVSDIGRSKGVAKKRKKKRKNNLDDDDKLDNMSSKERGVIRPQSFVPQFKRRRGETEDRFMRRIDRETQGVINKTKFEDKYQIGDYEPADLQPASKKSKTNEKTSLKRKNRLEEKRRRITEKKKQRQTDKYGDFKALTDHVQFGEVVQQPPTFTARPRKAPSEVSNKPLAGRKLLLSNLLEAAPTDTAINETGKSVISREVGKTVKRKLLSVAERESMDRERERSIELYRQMKKTKQQILTEET